MSRTSSLPNKSAYVALRIKDEPLEEEAVDNQIGCGSTTLESPHPTDSFEHLSSTESGNENQEEIQDRNKSWENQALILEDIEDIFATVSNNKVKKTKRVDPSCDDSGTYISEDSVNTIIANDEFEDNVEELNEPIKPQACPFLDSELSVRSDTDDNEELSMPESPDLLSQMIPCKVVLYTDEVTRYLELTSSSNRKPADPVKVTVSKPQPNKSRRPACNLCKKTFAHSLSLRRHKAIVHQTEPLCPHCRCYFMYLEEHTKGCKMRLAKEYKEKEDSREALEKLLRHKVPQMTANEHNSDSDVEVVDSKLHQKRTPSISPAISTTVKSQKPTTCKICNMTFVSIHSLRSHMYMVHGSEPQCHKCNRYFMDFAFLNDHVKTCSEGEKDRSLDSAADKQLNDIVKMAVKSSNNRFICPICKISVKGRGPLRTHCSNVHNFKPYCKKCKKPFGSKLEFQIHKCKYKYQKCNVCDIFVYNMRKHKACKHYTEPFCHRCEKYKASTETLEEHLKECLKHSKRSASFSCKVCGQKFLAGYLLRVHMAYEHLTEMICTTCNKFFKTFDELSVHTKDVHAEHSDFSLNNSKIQLKKTAPRGLPIAKADVEITSEESKHLEKSAVKKKPKSTPVFQKNDDNCCPLCVTCFKSEQMLDMHMKLYHKIRTKPVKVSNICKVCNRQCSTSYNLVSHVAAQHKILPECGGCGESFTVPLYYKHIKQCKTLTITVEKPLSKSIVVHSPAINNTPVAIKTVQAAKPRPTSNKHCDICCKVFSDLRRHKAAVHNTEPFCSKCHKLFETYDMLELHLEECLTALGKERRKRRLEKQKTSLDYGFVLVEPENLKVKELKSEFSPPAKKFRLDCEFCHNTFKTRRTLKMHMKNLHQTYINFCLYCHDKFSDKLKYKEHVNICIQSHPVLDEPGPSMEHLSFTSESVDDGSMLPAFEEVRVVEPNHSFLKTEAEETVNNLSLTFLETGTDVCHECNALFSSDIELKNHKNSEHKGTYLLCYPCKLELKSIPEFVAHIHTCEKSKEVIQTTDNNPLNKNLCETDLFESESISENFIACTTELDPQMLESQSELSIGSQTIAKTVLPAISDNNSKTVPSVQNIIHIKTENFESM